ncbi:MAG: AfsR/SARP family transcriptional regulator, partial [Ardenticatenaceae bacterium]
MATCRLYRLMGDAPTALTWANQGLDSLRRLGARQWEGQALIERAQAAWEAGDLQAAETDLCEALSVLALPGAAYELTLATFLLAALQHQQGQPEAEASWLDAARRIAQGGYAFLLQRERRLAFPLLAAHARSSRPEVRSATETLLEQLTRVAPLPLHIVGLGQFQVRQGRRIIPAAAWQRRKAGDLFRFMVLQPHRTATRDTILEALWPDQPMTSTVPQFHNATSALRHALEPDLPSKFPSRYLTVEAEQVTLHLPSGSTLDFERFEQALEEALQRAEPDVLTKALALYRGELFPLDRYAGWATGARERLDERYLHSLFALAQRYLAAGQAQQVLAHCRRLLEKDPWHEDAVLLGMRACLALNDRPSALRLYRDLEGTLHEELNLPPRADLKALAEALRSQ